MELYTSNPNIETASEAAQPATLPPAIVRAYRKKNIFQLQKISRRAARHVRGAIARMQKLKAREVKPAADADIKTVAEAAKTNAKLHNEAVKQTTRLQSAATRLAAVFAQIMQRRKPEAAK